MPHWLRNAFDYISSTPLGRWANDVAQRIGFAVSSPPPLRRAAVMPPAAPITPAEVNRSFVMSKCDFFMDVQLWPLQNELNPAAWLSNFGEREMPHALHLLNSFLYYSDRLVDELFTAAFQNLSTIVRGRSDSLLGAQAAWRAFVDSALVTYVTGEDPNPTDSGYTFARKARQRLGLPEERILTPDATLHELASRGPRPVVFVDDFVGTGNQFAKTWTRATRLSTGATVNFQQFSQQRNAQFYYCPVVATSTGIERIRRRYPSVVLMPAHVLSMRYSVLAADSLIWPPALQAGAASFVREASMRAGIPDTDGQDTSDWQGFQKLGLALAFSHSVPDATLPIFYWEQNGWRPLIKRV